MKKLLILIVIIFAAVGVKAQWVIGGNMGVHFYNSDIYANISPEFGRQFLPQKQLQIVISPFVSYTKSGSNSANHTYGVRSYVRYTIGQGLYLTGGYQYENFPTGNDSRKWQHALPCGAGYSRSLGGVTVYAECTYDLLYNSDSYGQNPIIRGGVNYSF